MNNEEFSNMSALWQQEEPAHAVDFAKLRTKRKRQRLWMAINLAFESITLAVLSVYWVYLLLTPWNMSEVVFVSIFLVWGWALFITLNRSRWRSFRLIKSVTVQDSIAAHSELLLLEERRWQVSFYATLGLLVVFVLFMIASAFHEPLNAEAIVFLVGAVGFFSLAMALFRIKRHQAARARKGLQS